MESKHYDLVVIGSGPAGEKGAAQAAYFGKSVALIEKEPALGGAAANTGTLPSKTLRETALYLSGFRQRGLYGMEINLKDRVTARDFLYRERLVVQSEHRRIADNIKLHKIDLYNGAAAFVDAHTIAVNPKPHGAGLTPQYPRSHPADRFHPVRSSREPDDARRMKTSSTRRRSASGSVTGA
ncbi:MAG: FAD-dependent oxidoreductase [Proteobacteria bacterium]|nr:FAD-dependent oxidoreductase [Pseudomonadota bacterium]